MRNLSNPRVRGVATIVLVAISILGISTSAFSASIKSGGTTTTTMAPKQTAAWWGRGSWGRRGGWGRRGWLRG